MRRTWFILCLAMGALLGVPRVSECVQYGHTIAVVNRERLYREYYRTKRAQKKLVERLQLYREEYRAQKKDVEELDESVKAARTDALNPDLTVSERDARRSFAEEQMLALTKARNDLQERTKLRNEELNNQATRMRERIMDKLDREIADYAERKGLLIVFNRTLHPNLPEPLAYVAPVLDITEAVLEMLNADAPAPDEEIDDEMLDLFGEEAGLTNASTESVSTNASEAAGAVPARSDEGKAAE